MQMRLLAALDPDAVAPELQLPRVALSPQPLTRQYSANNSNKYDRREKESSGPHHITPAITSACIPFCRLGDRGKVERGWVNSIPGLTHAACLVHLRASYIVHPPYRS